VLKVFYRLKKLLQLPLEKAKLKLLMIWLMVFIQKNHQ
jgi:hypothetical protein